MSISSILSICTVCTRCNQISLLSRLKPLPNGELSVFQDAFYSNPKFQGCQPCLQRLDHRSSWFFSQVPAHLVSVCLVRQLPSHLHSYDCNHAPAIWSSHSTNINELSPKPKLCEPACRGSVRYPSRNT
ncbi:hypothetical protein BDR03DRAFT_665342 [Suillus americanus]|nr:hypothetical protein BDR03DRAFT_665342 [Suillus americanus]